MGSKKGHVPAAACFLCGSAAFALLFKGGRTSDATVMLLAGFIGAAFLLYLPLQRKKEQEQRRREELIRDYSPLLTMLNLYMTAGLSLRSSWERMVRQYEEECRKGAPPRAAYEEMKTTWKEIKGGEYEDRAYGAFGRRCGTTEYLRLGGLLETYVQHGNRELLKQRKTNYGTDRRKKDLSGDQRGSTGTGKSFKGKGKESYPCCDPGGK